MYSYADSIVSTLPRGSVLVSHSDINWNSVRYVLECESKRPDVIHLSFQIMSYKWFKRQANLYPSIKFPNMNFPGLSTDISTNGNTKMVLDFVRANIKNHPHIYLDLTSIGVGFIGRNGVLGEFYIYPVGLVWKVTRSPMKPRIWERKAARAFSVIDKTYRVSTALVANAASWEYLSLKIYVDGLYQYSLRLLEVAELQQQNGLHFNELRLYYKRSEKAALIMNQIVNRYYDSVVPKGRRDLIKNAAVAEMRYYFAALTLKENNVVSPDIIATPSQLIRHTRFRLKQALEFDDRKDATMEAFKEFLAQYIL